MKLHSEKLLVIALAATLAGCGADDVKSPLAVGVDTSASEQTATDRSTDISISTQTGHAKSVTAKAPAGYVINQVLTNEFAVTSSYPDRAEAAESGVIWPRKVTPAQIKRLVREAELTETAEAAAFLAAVEAKDEPAIKAYAEHHLIKDALHDTFMIALTPWPAWEVTPTVDPRFDDPMFIEAMGGGRSRAQIEKTVKHYLNNFEVSGCVVNEIGGQIASTMAKRVMPNVEHAQKWTAQLVTGMPDADRKAILNKCAKEYPVDRKRVLEMSAKATGDSGGLIWTAGVLSFQVDAAGMSIHKASVPFMGESLYNGQTYDLAFASTAGMDESWSTGSGRGVSSDRSVKTNVKIGQ